MLSFKEHLRTTKFIMEAGHRLKLPPVTCASACVLYHRLYKQYLQYDYDATLVGCAALYLASKTEESPCKLRDVINVSYRMLHKDRAPLEVGSLYWELHDSVVNCELMMLRSLQFHVAFNNPHKTTSSPNLEKFSCPRKSSFVKSMPKETFPKLQEEEDLLFRSGIKTTNDAQFSNKPDSPFYLAINHRKKPEDSTWYTREMLKTAAARAGLQGKVTNHSVWKTSISRLMDADILVNLRSSAQRTQESEKP
ncbi:Cyclin- protein fam58a [Desmophyllum pertusum]|uniref:Cyclin- protein fam58a n=1 Tax=Desmophyllum pertusum TaxID=174260 RepID=A0A9W9ZBX1_9CNID|nr:Cyclin- protein fam58a [Desmophyllum pertusum]